MARLNQAKLPPQGGLPPRSFEPSNTLRTHEGAPAATISPELALRRSVCSCLLWENQFYEGGVEVASRITDLAKQVSPSVLAELAVDARSHFNLRHVPLLLLAVLAKTGSGSRLVSDTIAQTIQRADELTEFLAIYAKANGVAPSAVRSKLSAQVKKGLARAFENFDAYQLSKYDRGGAVRLRDALFLCHAGKASAPRNALWDQLVAGTLPSPDTWEVGLSGGADKREAFERLLGEGKLGYLALLRNLRGMTEAKVNPELIRLAIVGQRGARRVLPFRYVAAARACPSMTDALDEALRSSIATAMPLPGKTAVLVDVSSSMDARLSGKSDLTRMDAAATLAAVIPGDHLVYTFSDRTVEVHGCPSGLRGIEAVLRSQSHQGTRLGEAVSAMNRLDLDRLIVVTDEQSHDHVPEPTARRAYMINVAAYRHGVGYGERWTHLDGFSEQVLRFIPEFERLDEKPKEDTTPHGEGGPGSVSYFSMRD